MFQLHTVDQQQAIISANIKYAPCGFNSTRWISNWISSSGSGLNLQTFQLHTVDQQRTGEPVCSLILTSFNSTRWISNGLWFQGTRRITLVSTPHGGLATLFRRSSGLPLQSVSTPHGGLATPQVSLALSYSGLAFQLHTVDQQPA